MALVATLDLCLRSSDGGVRGSRGQGQPATGMVGEAEGPLLPTEEHGLRVSYLILLVVESRPNPFPRQAGLQACQDLEEIPLRRHRVSGHQYRPLLPHQHP